jgi:enterochelin esterase-like enzyme
MHGETPTPLALAGGALVLAATTWRSLTRRAPGHVTPASSKTPEGAPRDHSIAGAAVALLTALAAAARRAKRPQPPRRARPRRRAGPCDQAVPPCGPDSLPQPGVPKGEVIKGEFAASAIYPGTWREYWVYIPAGLDRTQPAPVMVFQDGLQYQAPVVFDNLIARKAIPPMVGVFVMHGRVKAGRDDARDRMNRSYEYDSFERHLRALPARRDAAVRREGRTASR